jgi:2-oxoglutarate/2-oxoacid ferredoxin oxidoreductase subunit beta
MIKKLLQKFEVCEKPDWCSGCGNFGIEIALKKALSDLKIEPHKVALITDIGCHGKMGQLLNVYGLQSLHGRALAVASGVRAVNKKLSVICEAGDGGAYGIGIGHLAQAIRADLKIVYLVHNNGVYALTKGQITPTTDPSISGIANFNPITFALNLGCRFVARGYAGDVTGLAEIIKAGLKHDGLALIDIFQPCVTFNKINTYQYYQKNSYRLPGACKKFYQAWELASEKKKFPIGIIYQRSM